jgi:hypothetical protein
MPQEIANSIQIARGRLYNDERFISHDPLLIPYNPVPGDAESGNRHATVGVQMNRGGAAPEPASKFFENYIGSILILVEPQYHPAFSHGTRPLSTAQICSLQATSPY